MNEKLIHALFVLCATSLAGCDAGQPLRHLRDPNALGPYSAAVALGDVVYLSGKIGQTNGSFEQEATSAIDAVSKGLRQAGLTLEEVFAVTVYLTDIANYATFNEIYGRHFSRPYPVRACVAVQALPGGARVEIVVVAKKH